MQSSNVIRLLLWHHAEKETIPDIEPKYLPTADTCADDTDQLTSICSYLFHHLDQKVPQERLPYDVFDSIEAELRPTLFLWSG